MQLGQIVGTLARHSRVLFFQGAQPCLHNRFVLRCFGVTSVLWLLGRGRRGPRRSQTPAELGNTFPQPINPGPLCRELPQLPPYMCEVREDGEHAAVRYPYQVFGKE